MVHKILKLLVVLACPTCLFAQTTNNQITPLAGSTPPRTTADMVIDGGKLALEIIKEVRNADKKTDQTQGKVLDTNNIDDCWKYRIADLCFENQTNLNISVEFVQKIDVQTYSDEVQRLQIAQGEKECNFIIPAGIYKYAVRSQKDGKSTIEKQGEITLEPCEQRVKILK